MCMSYTKILNYINIEQFSFSHCSLSLSHYVVLSKGVWRRGVLTSLFFFFLTEVITEWGEARVGDMYNSQTQ